MTFRDHVEQIPVTLLVALAYVTLSIVIDPFQPQPEKLAAYGWLTPMLVADGDWWRLLASAFLHGGIVHLVFNLSTLMSIGPALERSFGSVRFAVLYVVSALGGNVAVCLLRPPLEPVVGGSGALFGMLGALVALNMRAGRHSFSFLDFEGPRRLLSVIAVNLVIGFILPFISNTCHVGGLLAGFLVTLLWLVPPRSPSRPVVQWRLATAALFASLLFATVMPVMRWDWLWYRGVDAIDDDRRIALQRAATMSLLGTPDVSGADVRMLGEAIREVEAQLPENHRRRR